MRTLIQLNDYSLKNVLKRLLPAGLNLTFNFVVKLISFKKRFHQVRKPPWLSQSGISVDWLSNCQAKKLIKNKQARVGWGGEPLQGVMNYSTGLGGEGGGEQLSIVE